MNQTTGCLADTPNQTNESDNSTRQPGVWQTMVRRIFSSDSDFGCSGHLPQLIGAGSDLHDLRILLLDAVELSGVKRLASRSGIPSIFGEEPVHCCAGAALVLAQPWRVAASSHALQAGP